MRVCDFFLFFLIGRVWDLICMRVGIKKVLWDGYFKYYRLSFKLIEKKYYCFFNYIFFLCNV